MNKKILIAVPNAGLIEPATLISIYNMDVPSNIDTELKAFYGYLVDDVRNKIVKYALDNRFDGILFVDSDMNLPKNTLTQMLSQNKDIICGLYVRKRDDKKIIELFVKEDDPTTGKIIRNLREDEINGKDIIELKACGFGCVLVKTHVFPRIGYPYFKYNTSEDPRQILGEDIYFSNQAIYHGFKIYGLPKLKIGHIGKKEYNL
jgi:GT2 family glycosyltransferase